MAIIKRSFGNRKDIIIQKFREIRNDGLGGLAFDMFCEGWKCAWEEHTAVNQERIKELEAELEKPPQDILTCKCGWWGSMEQQDALGSECGCCPSCGNEALVWLSKLQRRFKDLEEQIFAYKKCSKNHDVKCPDVKCWVQKLRDEQMDKIEQQEERIKELKAKLKEFGNHKSNCAYVQGLRGNTIEKCDCGFDKLFH